MEAFDFIGSAQFWFFLGVVFLIAEVLSVSFFFLFLGVSALLTSLMVNLGLADALWIQFLWFAVLSVVTTLAFRKIALRMFGNNESKGKYSEFVGDRATVTRVIQPGITGRVSYRGTEWDAEALHHNQTLEVGAHVEIKKVDGMRLVVG